MNHEIRQKSTKQSVKTYRDLIVWQKSIQCVTDVYKVTQKFPQDELYGLTSQIRRCSVSIPSNIAEGYGRKSTQDYLRFLRISLGALYELQTQMVISLNLKFLEREDFDGLFESSREIERMLSSLISKVKPNE
jgi:four helix bundle protein